MPELVEVLKKNDFIHPTEVQTKTIPKVIALENILCSSETGSGKTLAFILPLIVLLHQKKISQALILSPTREIATQTQKVIEQLATPFNIKSALLIGGVDINRQKRILKEYPQIITATPGRLLDLLTNGFIWLEYTSFVVLDEADRMLDMGFEKDIIAIHRELPKKFQMVLFTATLLPSVKKIAQRYVSDYTEIIANDATLTAGRNIQHYLLHIDNKEKLNTLKQILLKENLKIIVFFNTIQKVKTVFNTLKKWQVKKIACLHSSKSQDERYKIIKGLKETRLRILLATDIASRGIDIPKVGIVVNYDVPYNDEEYIHRIGRTGRAGEKGLAYSLVTSKEHKNIKSIEKMLGEKILVAPKNIFY